MGEGLWSMVYGRRVTSSDLRLTNCDFRVANDEWGYFYWKM